MIDAVDGESADPGLAHGSIKADVNQQDVGVHHLLQGGQACARRCSGIHFDVRDALTGQRKMSEVGGEPAVNAVAMEDDLVRSLRSVRHDGMGVDIKNRNSIFNFLHHIHSSLFPAKQARHFVVMAGGFIRFSTESSIIENSILGMSNMIPDTIIERMIFSNFS